MQVYYRLFFSCFLILAVGLMPAMPVAAADAIAVRYGPFEESLPVADLRRYAETGAISTHLRAFLKYTDQSGQQRVREILQTKIPVDIVALDRVLNGTTGIQFLTQIAQATQEGEQLGVRALRSAALLGSQSEGSQSEGIQTPTSAIKKLSLFSFLEAYPTRRLTLSLPKALQIVEASAPKPPTDRLSRQLFWQTWVEYQATVNQGKQQQACLFGDSISSALGDTLGSQTYNFAIGGMSTVSLVEQLKRLVAQQVKCRTVVIAIGTNDAWYTLSDDHFRQNLHAAIALTRQLGPARIVLLPAFYSTFAASKKPDLAGPIPRVNAINQLIQQVATDEQVPVDAAVIQPLFVGQTLQETLTTDGVHLNAAGLTIYRQALLELLKDTP